MKQILFLCWLLSPTRKNIDWRTNNISAAQKGEKLRDWNKYLFHFELFLVPILILVPSIPCLLRWLLIAYAYSRCNEIAYAFGKDVFSRLNNDEPTSNLNPVMRIAMAMRSYVGLIINFALLYYLIPIVQLFNRQFTNFFEAIYFSGVTLTTLGYGDITPKHWLSQLLVLYEVLVGILLIVVVIATYIGSAGSIDEEK